MTQLPRCLHLVRSFVLSSFSLAAVVAVPFGVALAQEAPEAPPADAAAATEPSAPAAAGATDLLDSVENFWHYGKIARYDLAVAAAQEVIAHQDDPQAVLEAFEKVAAAHEDNLDGLLLRWQGVEDEPMREAAVQVINLVNEGYRARRSNPAFIEDAIQRMAGGERAYRLAIARLRESGELSVPLMIDYLRDPAKRQFHVAIRRALRDLGLLSLNPLHAATETKDNDLLNTIVSALGDIGYDASLPYLTRVAKLEGVAPAVQAAATQSIIRITGNDPGSLDAARLFYDLGEKFYYGNAATAADKRRDIGYVWYWNEDTGLRRVDVAREIYNDIMAMRASEQALKLDPQLGDAVSLWLAGNYKREADLPQGGADPTRAEGQPDAHYYGVAAGTQYLNSALSRALRDRNSAVALRVIKSLQEIVGQSNMFAGDAGGTPLLDAMQYPDRLVRYEAAFAIGAALPQQSFDAQERVVPLLAEALSQTGRPNVLVLTSEAQVNGTVQMLKDAGYGAAGSGNAEGAVAVSAQLPSVDLILISGDLPASAIDQLMVLASSNARLSRAARLIITKSQASPYAMQAVSDPLMNVTQATEGDALKAAIEQARSRSGALPLDEQAATGYALRAAELMHDLAISRGQVLDLIVAEPTLLGALDDARPDVIKASGQVLALLNSKNAQVGLLTKAADAKTADDVKISLYNSLATNAKFFGNQLDPTQIDTLQQVVSEAENLEVRSAAAEARGALNLPADQARTLIVEQSRL